MKKSNLKSLFILIFMCGLLFLNGSINVFAEEKLLQENLSEETATPAEIEKPSTPLYQYIQIEGGIKLTAYTGNETELIIPAEIDGQPVIELGEELFKDKPIVTVTVSEGIKRISESCFKNCTELTNVSLPDSIETVDPKAFEGCTSYIPVSSEEPEAYEQEKGALLENSEKEEQQAEIEAGGGIAVIANNELAHSMARSFYIDDLDLEPEKLTLNIGSSRNLYLEIEPRSAANNPVSWSSSNTNVATVDNNGLVRAVGAGTAYITVAAQDGSRERETCKVTVIGSGSNGSTGSGTIRIREIDVEPDKISLNPGASRTLRLEIEPYNATNKGVTWSSNNNSIATVDANGTVKGITAGTAIITATAKDGSNRRDTCRVTVTGTSSGSTGSGTIRIREIDVEPDKISLNPGASRTLRLEIEPYNATNKSVTWSSNNNSIATVDANGTVKGVKAGTAIITATAKDGSNKRDTCRVTVTGTSSGTTGSGTIRIREIDVEPDKINLNIGASRTLKLEVEPYNATNKGVTWSSSNSTIATVNANGTVKGIKAGTATITALAKDGSGKRDTCRVTVGSGNSGGTAPSTSGSIKIRDLDVQDNLTVNAGSNATIRIQISPSNATNKKINWKSSNTAIATVDSSGTVKGIKAGTVTITATASDGSNKRDTCRVTVKAGSGTSNSSGTKVTGITLKYQRLYLYVGETETASELKPTITPANAGNKKITWSSNNNNVITVNSAGKITAKATGTATLTATTADQAKTAKCTVTVTTKNTAASSVTASSSKVNLKAGKSVVLNLTSTPSNAYIKDIKDSVSTRNIISVDCEEENHAVEIKGLKKGTTTLNLTVVNNNGTQVKVTPITVTVN